MKLKSIFVIGDNISEVSALSSGANQFAEKVTSVVFGNEEYAKSTEILGSEKVIYCPLEDKYSAEDYSEIIAEIIKKEENTFVFVTNTILGRDLAARIAVKLDSPVFSNVDNINVVDNTIECTHTVYGGTAIRKIKFLSQFGLVTINAGTFDLDSSLSAASTFEKIAEEPKSALKLISKDVKNEVSVNLAVAKKIVDIGRSVGTTEDLEKFEKLASLLGAEIGCTRPVAENNKILEKSRYMGITGVQVKPDVLIAFGLSGQIQHIGGINKSKLIVAINKDKAAPIFKNCDFGIVGDMNKIVPKLIEKLS